MKRTSYLTADEVRAAYYGLDDLRAWLIKQGFKVSKDSLRSSDNGCNWYAWRRSEIPARECECNAGKPAQIVVRPYLFRHASAPTPSGAWESVEVDVTGEASGIWWTLQAYNVKPDELRERLSEIEFALISAWNAIPVQKARVVHFGLLDAGPDDEYRCGGPGCDGNCCQPVQSSDADA